MRRLLILCHTVFILTFSVCVFGQESELDQFNSNIESGLSHFELNDFKTANAFFEKAVDQIDSLFESGAIEAIDALYYYGNSLYRVGDFRKAAEMFKLAMDRLNLTDDSLKEYYDRIQHDYAATLINIPDKAAAQKEYSDLVNRTRKTPSEAEQIFMVRLYQLAEVCDSTGDSECFYNSIDELLKILEIQEKTDSEIYARAANYMAVFHFVRNNFKEALPFFEVVYNYPNELRLGQVNLKMFSTYYFGICQFRTSDFEKALRTFENALEYVSEVNAANLGHYAQVTGDYAETQFMLGQASAAETTLVKLLEKSTQLAGPESKQAAAALNRLGEYYIKIGQITKAMNHLSDSEANFIKRADTTSVEYSRVLANSGLVNYTVGRYAKAENQLKKSLIIEAEKVGENTITYANILGNYANLFHSTGRLEKARETHLRSLDLKAQILTENDPTYAKGLMNYGNFLMESGNLDEAKSVLEKSSKIVRDVLGEDHISYAEQLMNLGQLYYTKRNFKVALDIYEQATKIYLEKSDSNNPGYGMALTSQGLIYKELGDYETSIEVQNEAKRHIINTLGTDHIENIKIIQNLGQTYQQMGNLHNAFEQYNDALQILEKLGMNKQYLYAIVASNTAMLKMQLGEPDEALVLVDQALDIFVETHGRESFYYASGLQVKALITLRLGQIDQCIEILKESQELYEQTLGRENDAYLSSGFVMALAYDLKNDMNSALEHYRSYNQGIIELLKDVFSFRSEEDKRKYLAVLQQWLSWYNSLLLDERLSQDALAEEILNNTLLFKGLLLSTSLDLFQKLKDLDEPEINDKINQLSMNRNQLTKTLNSDITARRINIDSLRSVINILETDLVKVYNENFTEQVGFDKDWRNIKTKLKQDEVAIEFTHFKNQSLKSGNSELVYVAFIIRPDSDIPTVIRLSAEDQLISAFKNKNPDQLYSSRGSKGTSTLDTKKLYDLIWRPLEEYIRSDKVSTVYFSPSGILNQIAFAALYNDKGDYLSNTYNLIQLGSTYSITNELRNPEYGSALFIGGLDYDSVSSDQGGTNVSYLNSQSLRNSKATRGYDDSWNYLPGTLTEVTGLLNMFENVNSTTSLWKGENGSEESFKGLSGNSPDLIHIATHGFFFENLKSSQNSEPGTSVGNMYKLAEDPLLRSGLIFSGGNLSWNSTEEATSENGILTAMEISDLDLSNTDMVVLSACETGLGDIDGSEGVYGLQRAFKMAGVDMIIMSLWQVPDKETAEFMTLFYENWLGGMDVRTAFNETQKRMQQRYREEPLKWAAFVLME